MTFVIIFMCVESDLRWHHGNRINMWPLHSALECLAWLATVHYVQTVTHEYDYKGRNLASTVVALYYNGVGYSPSLFIIYS